MREYGYSGGEGELRQPATMVLYTTRKEHAGSVAKEIRAHLLVKNFEIGSSAVAQSIGDVASRMPQMVKCGGKRSVPVTAGTVRAGCIKLQNTVHTKGGVRITALPE